MAGAGEYIIADLAEVFTVYCSLQRAPAAGIGKARNGIGPPTYTARVTACRQARGTPRTRTRR
jgi:hypothetical protein